MHLFNVDVVHLILIKLIRRDVNSSQSQVQNGQSISSWSVDLVIKNCYFEVVHAERGSPFWNSEILQRLYEYWGASWRVNVTTVYKNIPAFLCIQRAL